MVTDYGTEVILIKPQQTSRALGSGVKEETGGARFRLIELEEYNTWYGKPFFRNLIPTLKEIAPDIVVMSAWPYFLHFLLQPLFYVRFSMLGCKLICRDIPFNISYWGKSRSYYFSGRHVTEDLNAGTRSLAGYLPFWFITVLRRIYLPLADAHLNYYEEGKAITASYGVSPDKIFVVANSPDTDALLAAYQQVKTLPPILPPNPHRIIHVGRLVKWKKVDMLIRAVHDLKTAIPGIELVVIGTGPETEPLRHLAEELGVAQDVRFIGGVYDSILLGQYLEASSIYVLAGMGGLSINDAMCFGKPVVCSVADGTEKSLVRENFNGFYFDNTRQESLNEVLTKLLTAPDLIRMFGANSLTIIREEINIHTVLKKYDTAFRYVLKQ